jgi:hypothetical protein
VPRDSITWQARGILPSKYRGGRIFADCFRLSQPILNHVFEVWNFQKWNYGTFFKKFVQNLDVAKITSWKKKNSKKNGQKIGKNYLTLVLNYGYFPFFSQKLKKIMIFSRKITLAMNLSFGHGKNYFIDQTCSVKCLF